jgi:hypothetical protein
MPISSGFGYFPYHYPTTRTDRIIQPQIVARAPKVKYPFCLIFIYNFARNLLFTKNLQKKHNKKKNKKITLTIFVNIKSTNRVV